MNHVMSPHVPERIFKDHPEMPCLGQRFATDQIIIDLNEAEPFDVDFLCPDLVFSLQLGVRDYSIGINSDRIVRRTIPAGAITLTPESCTIRAYTENYDPEFLAFSIKGEFVEEVLAESNLSLGTLPVAPDLRHPEFLIFADLLKRFLTGGAGRSPIYAETLCLGLLHTMFSELESGTQSPPITPSLSDKAVSRVLEYVEAHLAHPIGLQDLAAVNNQRMRTFSLAFKERTGLAPYAYVLKRRVEKARELICQTDIPLVEIAYECGFSSQAHMTSVFKQKLGVTPGRVRQDR
ncbi:MAG: AraC family transcriptional regulator [Pseudomonadota bacterium]